MPTPVEKLNEIVTEEKKAAAAPVKEMGIQLRYVKKVCKICTHEHRDAIETLYLQAKEKNYSVRQIAEAIQKNLDENISATNIRGHFGLTKVKGTDTLRPAHTMTGMLDKTVTKIIQDRADKLVNEKATEVGIEELKRRSRVAGGAWLDSIEVREHLLKDEVGVKLLALSIDADLKEKHIELKRQQGSQMSAALLGSIGLLGAIFGGKVSVTPQEEKPKPIDVSIVDGPLDPPLPAGGTP
jgi:hypothetical protein